MAISKGKFRYLRGVYFKKRMMNRFVENIASQWWLDIHQVRVFRENLKAEFEKLKKLDWSPEEFEKIGIHIQPPAFVSKVAERGSYDGAARGK